MNRVLTSFRLEKNDVLFTMANYYIHVPSQTEPGALTAKELLYAQMPCYFGIQDCTTGKFIRRYLEVR